MSAGLPVDKGFREEEQESQVQVELGQNNIKGVSKVFAVKKNSIISKNIYIFQLISQENNPWLPKQLGSCQAWRKIDFGESQLRFSSRQFSKSSPCANSICVL